MRAKFRGKEIGSEIRKYLVGAFWKTQVKKILQMVDSLSEERKHPEVVQYLNGYYNHYYKNNDSAAKFCFSQVITSGSKSCFALQFSYAIRGDILFDERKFEEAIRDFQFAFWYGRQCPIGEEHFNFITQIGGCYVELGKTDLALKCLDFIIENAIEENTKETARKNKAYLLYQSKNVNIQ